MKGVNLRSKNKYEPTLFQGGMKSHSSVNASGNLIESRCDFFFPWKSNLVSKAIACSFLLNRLGAKIGL